MFELDIDAANRKLSEFSYDLLRDKDGLSLRPYQIEALEKTEAAVIRGGKAALLEMAAGTGKPAYCRVLYTAF
jgi:type I restriction enzyme R subunit